MDNDERSYAERVGDQVRGLVETHEVLMHSDAEMAARKVRHALANYMSQVDHVLGEQDGGRSPRTFREMKDSEVDPQIAFEDKYPQCPECGSTGCETVAEKGSPAHPCPGAPESKEAESE